MLNFFRELKAEMGDEAGLVEILQKAQVAVESGSDSAQQIADELLVFGEAQAEAHRSIETYKALLRDDPSDEEVRVELKQLYKQTQGHNALVELLRQQLERTPEEEYQLRLGLYREMAEVYRRYMKSDTGLVNVLNQIVNLDGKLDEQDIDEVRELVSLYEKLGRHRDLLATQKLLAEIVPELSEKISLYRQVGRRWLEQFSNVQHATQAFASLYALAPQDPEALERLEELYRKRRSWKELFSLYEEQLNSLDGKARVPLLKEMAQLAAERLSRITDALGFYQEILAFDPTRIDVIERMEKHAERSKSWQILAEVLELRLGQMPVDELSLPVLQKLGGIYAEQLADTEQAIRTWQRVVEVQPGHSRAMRVLRDTFLRAQRLDELEQLYLSQNDLEGLAEVLSTAADRNKVPEQKLELSYRAASVYEEKLEQAPRAIRSYERILTIQKGDERAIARLLPLYEQEEWLSTSDSLRFQKNVYQTAEGQFAMPELHMSLLQSYQKPLYF